MTRSDAATGRSQRGAVRFAARLPANRVEHGPCTMCRRAHGAAFVTWVGVADTSFESADPDGVLRWCASSPGAQRGFCSRCGSMLLFRTRRWPGEIHVGRANLDAALDREPQAHVL